MPESFEPSPEQSPLYRELEIKPAFADERDAPPVDHARLLRYYRRELDVNVSREVRDCICTFRSWYSAFGAIVESRGSEEA